ncbi:MAG: hypothetical protein ACKOOF_05580 [Planctomycetaceae bacterium]
MLPARMIRVCVFSCAAMLAAVAHAQAPAQGVNIVLEDQFRNSRATDQLRGHVVVLVYADRHGAEKALDIGRRLHLRFHPTADGAEATQWSRQPVVAPAGWPVGAAVPDVHVVPVACVPEVPKPLHGVARSRLRKESPHVSVWLDFDDVLREQFGAAPGEPNIAVIDTSGQPHGTMAGVVDGQRFEDLVGVIDQLRLRARPDVRSAVVPVSGVR